MNLSDMTVPQLREIAADLYVNGRSKMKKADLIDAIESHRKAEQDRAAERDAYLKMNDADRKQAQDEMNERNRPSKTDEVDLSGMATMLGADVFGTNDAEEIEINTLPDPDGMWFDEVDEVSTEPSVYEDPAVRAAIRETVAEQAAYIEEGIEQDEADAAEHAHGEQVVLTKYCANEAIATAVFGGRSVAGSVIRQRGRWVLHAEGRTIRARTLGKVAKLWAKALGFHATVVVETMS